MALPGNPMTSVNGVNARWSAAVGDLYQACHLRPPGVVVARDAVDLARLIRLAAPGWNPAPALLLITVFALLGSVALTLWPATASLGAFLSADFGLVMLPTCTVLFTPPIWRPSFIIGRAGLRLAAAAAAAIMAAWLHAGDLPEDSHIWAAALGRFPGVRSGGPGVAPTFCFRPGDRLIPSEHHGFVQRVPAGRPGRA